MQSQAANFPVMSAPIASSLFSTRGPWPAEEMRKHVATPGNLDNTRAGLGAVTGELRAGVIMTVDMDGDIMGSCLALHDSQMWRVGYKASQVSPLLREKGKEEIVIEELNLQIFATSVWGRVLENVDITLDLPASAFTFPRGGEVRE